jgi:hypothetical protein
VSSSALPVAEVAFVRSSTTPVTVSGSSIGIPQAPSVPPTRATSTGGIGPSTSSSQRDWLANNGAIGSMRDYEDDFLSPVNNDDEEEQFLRAQAMSLADHLPWDPSNLQETQNKLMEYELVMDDFTYAQQAADAHNPPLALDAYNTFERGTVEGTPISEGELLSLLGTSGNLGMREYENDTHSQYSYSTGGLGGGASQSSGHHHPLRGREMMIKEKMDSICRNLRWYQDRIQRELATTEVCCFLCLHMYPVIHNFSFRFLFLF